jgi:glucose/arabinose dehydrogenase
MRTLLLATVLVAVLSAPAAAAGGARLQRVARFHQPVYATGVPGEPAALAVVERRGRIRLLRHGRVAARPLADLRGRVVRPNADAEIDQRGMLSMAFAPDYRRSGRFYVDYVARDGHEVVDELVRGRPGARRVLDVGVAYEMHHGGQLQFGPDGLLYVSTGVNDEPASSQEPAWLWGKLLRLDPRIAGATPEVYALGLRNPWRFSFDRRTGALFVGDVGDDREEEVDVIARGAPAGSNFGYPTYEGTIRRDGDEIPGARRPAATFPHDGDHCAVVGGYVVRDRHVPALRGRYVYGDVCTGELYAARASRTGLGRSRRLPLRIRYLVSFGEDAAGRVYAVSLEGGVYRLIAR